MPPGILRPHRGPHTRNLTRSLGGGRRRRGGNGNARCNGNYQRGEPHGSTVPSGVRGGSRTRTSQDHNLVLYRVKLRAQCPSEELNLGHLASQASALPLS